MSFTLYDYVLSGNCYKVRLLAALLKTEYTTVAVDFHPGMAHKSADMLALNPAGTLPVLSTEDTTLTETAAMLFWLARNYDNSRSWWPENNITMQTQVIEWLAFSTRLTSSIGALRLHTMLKRPVDVAAATAEATQALRALELHLTEQQLGGRKWLAGEHATIADIACFAYTALSPDANIEHEPYPAIRNWMYEIKRLPDFITMPGIHPLHELNPSPRPQDSTQ